MVQPISLFLERFNFQEPTTVTTSKESSISGKKKTTQTKVPFEADMSFRSSKTELALAILKQLLGVSKELSPSEQVTVTITKGDKRFATNTSYCTPTSYTREEKVGERYVSAGRNECDDWEWEHYEPVYE